MAHLYLPAVEAPRKDGPQVVHLPIHRRQTQVVDQVHFLLELGLDQDWVHVLQGPRLHQVHEPRRLQQLQEGLKVLALLTPVVETILTVPMIDPLPYHPN